MPLTITYLGHSGFLLDDGTHRVAIDPFLTGNDLAKHTPADIRCQTVALTHGHADHLGDAIAIAKANDAALVATFELCTYAGEQGVQKLEPGNTGGQIATDFGFIAFTPALHSSSYEGRYMGVACGLVVRIGGVTFYHCGDTALFSDMRLISEIYQPDIAAIPVGDRFTMGPELANRAAEFIQPRVAIPVHYRTFGMLRPTAEGFSPPGIEVKTLEPGEVWRYE